VLLVQIKFKHYAPKDSEEGTKEWIVCDSEDEALDYINEEHLYGVFNEEPEEASFYPTAEWCRENPTKSAEALSMGLRVDEWNTWFGPNHAITKWLRGTWWQEVTDAYYGVTKYDWSNQQEISEEDVKVLVRLAFVKDIRTVEEGRQYPRSKDSPPYE
jgi:hypothetical protein